MNIYIKTLALISSVTFIGIPLAYTEIQNQQYVCGSIGVEYAMIEYSNERYVIYNRLITQYIFHYLNKPWYGDQALFSVEGKSGLNDGIKAILWEYGNRYHANSFRIHKSENHLYKIILNGDRGMSMRGNVNVTINNDNVSIIFNGQGSWNSETVINNDSGQQVDSAEASTNGFRPSNLPGSPR